MPKKVHLEPVCNGSVKATCSLTIEYLKYVFVVVYHKTVYLIKSCRLCLHTDHCNQVTIHWHFRDPLQESIHFVTTVEVDF